MCRWKFLAASKSSLQAAKELLKHHSARDDTQFSKGHSGANVETLMRFRWLVPSGLAVRSRKQQRCTNVERIFDEDIECSKGGLMQSHLRICLSVANAANFARTGFLRRAFSEKMEAASKGAAILKIGKNKKPKEVNADEWKSAMSPLEYSVTREAGTERPFTGKYDKHFEEGEYSCFCCGAKLFRSDAKYWSGCGWPAFSKSIDNDLNIVRIKDYSLGMERTEVRCKQCNAHLGHVFDDGPKETGERYCINSCSLDFIKKD